ncbi:transcriptional regulator, TetR family [Actinomyces sp. oral taxon 172 str. F0311]|nr:transcriptional regulator, TetR family [Actinomyces sp. oral taxon 172 str. F0311]
MIDPGKLVSQAFAIASRDGISALSVRKVAAACGIAVGSVYGYFPTKADLTAAVLTRFFDENLSDELCAVRPGERFTSYVRRFREALCAARVGMSVDWFAEMRRLPSGEQKALEAVRAPMLAHIERGLRSVLDADEAVDRSQLVGPMSADALCRYVLRSIFASLMEGGECETLFALLDAALYETTAEEKETKQ